MKTIILLLALATALSAGHRYETPKGDAHTPEPSTWIAGLTALGVLAIAKRRAK